eukprot:jgi/Botrbrau1/2959/Bobra.0026s0027.1
MRSSDGRSYYAVLANMSESEREELVQGSTAGSSGNRAQAENKTEEKSIQKPKANRFGPSGILQPLVWIDLEMTGLDVEQHTILEVACLITDGDLEREIEGPNLVIHHDDEVLENMNEWSKEQHGLSGLTQRSRESMVTMEEAESKILEFVKEHTDAQAQLAGNSIHVDFLFLKRYMPRLAEHLHYRLVDVSTVGEIARRWFPIQYRKAPKKRGTHTALADIKESVKELRYYQGAIFKPPQGRPG